MHVERTAPHVDDAEDRPGRFAMAIVFAAPDAKEAREAAETLLTPPQSIHAETGVVFIGDPSRVADLAEYDTRGVATALLTDPAIDGNSDAERASQTEPLAFIDHHRQNYADAVPAEEDGDFLIGEYAEGDQGTGRLGEFKILLHRFDRQPMLSPKMCVFGDATGALARITQLAGGSLTDLLSDVGSRDEFSRRLLALGLRDASDKPMGGRS